MRTNTNRYYREEAADITFDLISESVHVEQMSANKATIERLKKFQAEDDDTTFEEDEELEDGEVRYEGTVIFSFDGYRAASYSFDETIYVDIETGELEW